MFQVISIILAGDKYIINVAAHLWNAVQDNIHGLLKHRRCRCDAVGQPGVLVGTFVGIDGREWLGLIIKTQLLVGLSQIKLGELLTSS